MSRGRIRILVTHCSHQHFDQLIRYSLLDEIIACVIKDWEERDASDECAMTRMAYAACRFSNLVIFSNTSSVVFYAIGNLLMWHKADNQTNDSRELFLKMELPFDMESESVYVTVLITQFVHQMSAASLLGMLDCLMLTLVSASPR